jgi:hypothetical protein
MCHYLRGWSHLEHYVIHLRGCPLAPGDSRRDMSIALGNNHWSQQYHAKAVIHPVTGKEMEYAALMKDPRLQPLWTRGFGNECGRLFQGI